MTTTLPTPAELKQQEAINAALAKAGLPQNKLNGLIEMAKDRLLCDSACQKERTAKELKNKWDMAQNNLRNAPEEVNVAERNYYTFINGSNAYNTILTSKNSKNAEEFRKNAMTKHTDLNKELNILLQTYETNTLYLTKMNELLKIKLEEQKELKRDIDQYIAGVQTNDRKVIYQNHDMDWLGTSRKALFFLYWSIFILYFLFSDFFSQGKYKVIKNWFIIFGYVIFPSVLNWIVRQLFALIDYIAHLFTRRSEQNVYVTMNPS
jgi:hypothetical protein